MRTKAMTRPIREIRSDDPPAPRSSEHQLLGQSPVFARHETFVPRPGWLKKGFTAAATCETLFLEEDAPVRLGVGKNMARAIRYWCHAMKLLEDVPIPKSRALASRPTKTGLALLGSAGWDPFLEDTGSLWYLHWKLIQGPSIATAWRYAFTMFPEREFTVDQLQAALQQCVARAYPTARAAETSLRKDILCITRMYAECPVEGAITEESIASPFADLGLLQAASDTRAFIFDVGHKAHLPALVVVAACLEYAASAAPGRRTIGVGRLLFEPGSPGMAFKLSESALIAAVESVTMQHRSVSIADTAGLVQLSFADDPEHLASDLLAVHYTSETMRDRRPRPYGALQAVKVR